MKTLQNNFTTSEQSKRLLKLGVPADSADMYYKQYSEAVVWAGEVGGVPQGKTFYMHEPALRHINPEGTWTYKDGERIDLSRKVDELRKTDIPCWSVGRLIEICLKCSTLGQRQVCFFCNRDDEEYSLIDYVVTVLESGVMTSHMDFSKLEE